MRRKVQSQVPQSHVCVVMTEPSVEASRPTMMTVQASRRGSVSPQVGQTADVVGVFSWGPLKIVRRSSGRPGPAKE